MPFIACLTNTQQKLQRLELITSRKTRHPHPPHTRGDCVCRVRCSRPLSNSQTTSPPSPQHHHPAALGYQEATSNQSPDPSKLNSVPTPPQRTEISRFHAHTTSKGHVRTVLRRPRPPGRSIIDDSTSEHHHAYQNSRLVSGRVLLRKEVIQPHLPVRLPCYDFVPIASPTFDGSLPQGVRPPASGVADFRGVTGGVYKARERIHRCIADQRLLAIPT